MSISSELSELSANKAAIKAAIEAKNPTTPPTAALGQWPTAIASIPGPKPEQSKTVTPTAAGFTVTPDSGKVLSSVVVNGDAGLVAGNIKKDVNIFGVTGSYEGSGGGLTGYTLSLRGDAGDLRGIRSIAVLYSDASVSVMQTLATLYSDDITLNNVVGYVCIGNDHIQYGQFIPLSGNTSVVLPCECLLRGTLVTLADGRTKPIEEIGYDDELLVWDFERGETAAARPLWIKKAERVNYKYAVRFASGNTLDVTGPHGHRAFNIDQARFEYLPRSVGDGVYTLKGVDTVVACEYVKGDFEFYNIITAGHLNLFANSILTSCRLNNCRAFDAERMKWASKADVRHPRSDFDGLPNDWVDGLHLCEQPTPAEELVAYVSNLVNIAK